MINVNISVDNKNHNLLIEILTKVEINANMQLFFVCLYVLPLFCFYVIFVYFLDEIVVTDQKHK